MPKEMVIKGSAEPVRPFIRAIESAWIEREKVASWEGGSKESVSTTESVAAEAPAASSFSMADMDQEPEESLDPCEGSWMGRMNVPMSHDSRVQATVPAERRGAALTGESKTRIWKGSVYPPTRATGRVKAGQAGALVPGGAGGER